VKCGSGPADRLVRDSAKRSVTTTWRERQARCRDLGPESVPVFLDTLEHGTENASTPPWSRVGCG